MKDKNKLKLIIAGLLLGVGFSNIAHAGDVLDEKKRFSTILGEIADLEQKVYQTVSLETGYTEEAVVGVVDYSNTDSLSKVLEEKNRKNFLLRTELNTAISDINRKFDREDQLRKRIQDVTITNKLTGMLQNGNINDVSIFDEAFEINKIAKLLSQDDYIKEADIEKERVAVPFDFGVRRFHLFNSAVRDLHDRVRVADRCLSTDETEFNICIRVLLEKSTRDYITYADEDTSATGAAKGVLQVLDKFLAETDTTITEPVAKPKIPGVGSNKNRLTVRGLGVDIEPVPVDRTHTENSLQRLYYGVGNILSHGKEQILNIGNPFNTSKVFRAAKKGTSALGNLLTNPPEERGDGTINFRPWEIPTDVPVTARQLAEEEETRKKSGLVRSPDSLSSEYNQFLSETLTDVEQGFLADTLSDAIAAKTQSERINQERYFEELEKMLGYSELLSTKMDELYNSVLESYQDVLRNS